MDNELMLDVGQANELKLAFRRNGWNNADVKRLSEGDLAARLLPAVRGLAKVVAIKNVIDCDATPYVPKGWGVETHKKDGILEWDPQRVRLYLSPNQQGDKYIEGHKLRKELEGQPVLNANVLDYLLQHPELIPEEWKTKVVFSWGTIYRSPDGYLSVRYLGWDGERWRWDYDWLDNDWDCDSPALLRAS